MRCPHCGKQPLSFAQFWGGINAVRTKCASCGNQLKANAVTWLWLVVAIILSGLLVVFLTSDIGNEFFSGQAGKAMLLICIGVCAIMSWLTGGYLPVGRVRKPGRPDSDKIRF